MLAQRGFEVPDAARAWILAATVEEAQRLVERAVTVPSVDALFTP